MKKDNIIIVGDSISEGIGQKKINYEIFLKKAMNKYNIINMARTGTTIKYGNTISEEIIKLNPKYVIIFYGNVDAQIRANINGKKTKLINFIPNRYKKNGMLDPRPFYSKKWYRWIPDRLDNVVRFYIKKMVIHFEGTIQWVSIEEFEKEYTDFIIKLKENSIIPIIISTIFLDDDYFLNSNIEYEKYNNVLKKISQKNNCIYIDFYSSLKKYVNNKGVWDLYSSDHFHPNEYGYKYLSYLISKKMKDIERGNK